MKFATALQDPGARVLVVAVSRYLPSSRLTSYRAIDVSAARLEEALTTRCGLAQERLRVLLNPTAEHWRRALAEEADKSGQGAFVFYYIGHGLLQTVRGEGTYLALAAADTRLAFDPADDLHDLKYDDNTVVRYDFVGDVLASLRQQPSVAVLDCCFSAAASRGFSMAASAEFARTTPSGSYLLAAAGPNQFAFAPDPADPAARDDPTWFTGALVRLLTDGDAGLPPLITLEDCYEHLTSLAARPQAGLQRTAPWAVRSGEAGRLVLADNPAVRYPASPDLLPPDETVRCPYMGLEPYRAQDATLFRGRADAVAALARILPDCAESGVPLIVTGASGVGKSSLARAGLLFHLERGLIAGWPASHDWPVVDLIPGRDPLAALAAKLADLAGTQAEAVLKDLRADPELITRYVEQIASRPRFAPGQRLVLLVDQFEEVFTLRPDGNGSSADRDRYVQALQAAASGSALGRRAVVILVVRGDYFVSCSNFPGLLSTQPRNDSVVRPMTDPELRAVITEPAEQVGLVATPQMVERVLADLRMGLDAGPRPAHGGDDQAQPMAQGHDVAGILPLISYALEQTFAKREGRLLTLAGYEASGGVWGAVARSADEVYRQLGDVPDGQQAAKRLLLDMVQLGENSDDSRRRIDLNSPSLGDLPPAALAEAVRLFTSARLITVDNNPDGSRGATLSHEAILRSWPTLRGWIEVDRVGLLTRQQLLDAVREWQRTGFENGRLYRGRRLADAWEWARQPHRWRELPAEAQSFLRMSRKSEAAERRRARRSRIAMRVAVGLVLATIAGIAIFQYEQTVSLRHQRDVALSQQAAEAADNMRSSAVPESMLLALSAYNINANAQTESALLETYSENATTSVLQPIGQFIKTGSLSPTVPVMALGVGENTSKTSPVTLWNVSDPIHPRQLPIKLLGPAGGIEDVQFSPDGRLLVAAADAGVWMWRIGGVSHGSVAGTRLPDTAASFGIVDFSADGRWLAAARDGDSSVLAWNLDELGQPQVMESQLSSAEQFAGVSALSFAASRELYVSLGDGSVWTWNFHSDAAGSARQVLPPDDRVTTLSVSNSGNILATGTTTGQVIFWNIASSQPKNTGDPITEGHVGIGSLAFSAGGGAIAVGSADWSVSVWGVSSRRLMQAFHMDSGVQQIGFMWHGGALLAVDGSSNAELWDLQGSVISGPSEEINAVAVRPDGKLIAAASDDGTVRLWSVTDSHHYDAVGKPLYLLKDHIIEFATAAAFSPDGKVLAVGGSDGYVYLWNVSHPATPVLLGGQFRPQLTAKAAPSSVTSLLFLHGGQILVDANASGQRYFTDLANPAKPSRMYSLSIKGTSGITQIAVDHAERTMAIATNAGVYLEDISNVQNPRLIGQLRLPNGSPDAFSKVAFSPTGDLLMTGGQLSNTEQIGALFDASNPDNPTFLSYVSGPGNGVYSFAFSPDGQTLAGGSADNNVWLWNISNPAKPVVEATLSGHSQWVMSVAYATDSLLVSASADTTIRLWDTSPPSVSQSICSMYPGTANFPQDQWDRWLSALAYKTPCP